MENGFHLEMGIGEGVNGKFESRLEGRAVSAKMKVNRFNS